MEALSPEEKAAVEKYMNLVETYSARVAKITGHWLNSNVMDSIRSDLYLSLIDSVSKFMRQGVTGCIKGYILSGFKFTLLKRRSKWAIQAGVEVAFCDLHLEPDDFGEEDPGAVDQMLVDRLLGELDLGPAQQRVVTLRYSERMSDKDIIREMKISKQRLGAIGWKIAQKMNELCVREGLEFDDFVE